ncbi:MAG: tyrosine-protein phosphatase [Microthrixaceae bacterium]
MFPGGDLSTSRLRTELARDGIFNTRDLGGMTTLDGRVIRPGRVIRADALQRVRQSASIFKAAGVTRVLDLREDAERERAGILQLDGIEVIHHPVLDPTFGWTSDAGLAPAELLRTLYREILESFGDRFASALTEIAQVIDSGPSGAVAYHCSLGKDRTGLLTAILLSLLGVTEDEIVADYARSANATAVQLQWLWSFGLIGDEVADEDLSDGLWSARPDTLRSTLEWVRGHYGGFDNYVLDVGLDQTVIETLREDLLTSGVQIADQG